MAVACSRIIILSLCPIQLQKVTSKKIPTCMSFYGLALVYRKGVVVPGLCSDWTFRDTTVPCPGQQLLYSILGPTSDDVGHNQVSSKQVSLVFLAPL